MAKTAVPTLWKNRIVGSGVEDPEHLLANPGNYRRHSQQQRDTLRDLLGNVGWVQNVIVNRTTGHLVDGHLRVDLALQDGETEVPVVYVELSDAEERIALAALDPIGAMATPDPRALDNLLAGLDVDGEALSLMLTGLMALPDLPDDLTGADPNRGEDLAGLDVSMADPRHQPKRGQTWKLGPHVLHVGSVHLDWPVYTAHLVEGAAFAPYPSPMLAVLYDKGPLVMVQPDLYLAGHVLDKWESKNGAPELLA